jgi:release factor glutamine methyltransferase
VDISEGALKVARENNEKLGGKVTFHKVDILDNAEWHQISGTFDIIVSNPPYIPNSEKTLMSANVLDNEPHLALFVEDDDPLIFYNKIHELAKSKLQKDGVIFLECNEFNAQEVKQIYSESYDAEVINDMQGKERIVIAKRSIRMMK